MSRVLLDQSARSGYTWAAYRVIPGEDGTTTNKYCTQGETAAAVAELFKKSGKAVVADITKTYCFRKKADSAKSRRWTT